MLSEFSSKQKPEKKKQKIDFPRKFHSQLQKRISSFSERNSQGTQIMSRNFLSNTESRHVSNPKADEMTTNNHTTVGRNKNEILWLVSIQPYTETVMYADRMICR